MNKSKVNDEIGENLKQTMRRINELETENDVVNEQNEFSNSVNNNYMKNSKLSASKRTFQNNQSNLNESHNKNTNFKNSGHNYQISNESFQNSRGNFNKKTNNFNNSNNNFENENCFKSYSNNILKNLDDLYNDIYKDFTELENFIQNSIQQ